MSNTNKMSSFMTQRQPPITRMKTRSQTQSTGVDAEASSDHISGSLPVAKDGTLEMKVVGRLFESVIYVKQGQSQTKRGSEDEGEKMEVK